jgi:hypothetical protein
MFGRAGHGGLGALFAAPARLELGVELRRVASRLLEFLRADAPGQKQAAQSCHAYRPFNHAITPANMNIRT